MTFEVSRTKTITQYATIDAEDWEQAIDKARYEIEEEDWEINPNDEYYDWEYNADEEEE